MIKKVIKYICFKIYSIGKNKELWNNNLERKSSLNKSAFIDPTTWISDSCSIYNFQNERLKIMVGKDSKLMSELLILPYGGKISIGNNCFVGPGTRIWSGENISIGNNVLIGHNVNIIDFSHERNHIDRAEGFSNLIKHGHPLEKGKIPARQIIIEDDVIIYAGANILMGVTIGKGSIISAGSVVLKDVPAFSQVLGNPSRVIWKTS